MFKKIKKKFPKLYEVYLSLKRKNVILKSFLIKQVPPKYYPFLLEILYFKRFKHKLDWKNLRTYTEKMQWEKIYNNNPLKKILTDKYTVREWVKSKIGEDYLIPLLGVWNKVEDINFDILPNQFVLKTNHGSGTNIIVQDKSTHDFNQSKKKLNDWLLINYAFKPALELHYSDIPPKIIAEKYIVTENYELNDYKFLCFDGEPYFCWVDMGRYSEHTRNVYDLKWNLQPWNQEEYNIYKEPIPKPINFDKMVNIVRILSRDFSQVRVDLYNVNGIIYFGEMTFTNGSGMDRILPNEYDIMLGDLWNLPVDERKV